MKKVIFSISIWCFLFGIGSATAQSVILQNYVDEGIQANLALLRQQIQIDQQRSIAREALADKAIQLDFKADYTLAFGGRSLAFPIGDLLNPVYQTLNEVTAQNTFPTDLENVDEQFLPSNFHDTRFVASKAIINPAIYYNYKAQTQLISVEEAKLETAKMNLSSEIQTAYLNYLKTRRVEAIYDSTEVLLKEVLRVNQKLVKYDKATEDAVASVEFELEQLKSDRVGNIRDQQITQAYFNTLLNKDLDTPIAIDPNLSIRGVAETIEELENIAVSKSPELRQISEGIKANQIVESLQQKLYQPTLGAQISAGFQGFGYNFDGEQAYILAGIGLNWRLLDGKKKNRNIEQAQMETMKLANDQDQVRQQVQLRVRQAWYYFNASEKSLDAQKAALRSANRSFRIIKNRYESNQAILLEYLDARTKLTNARIAVSLAEYDVMIRQVELNRAIAGI